MIVIKRDGLKAEFDRQKIFNAVKKANDNSNSSKKMSDLSIDIVVKDVTSSLAKKKEVGVEEIQDLVIKNLKKTGFKELAKEYSDFREKRSRDRNKNSAFMKKISVKLTAKDVQYQNANVDEFSYGGRKGEASSELNRFVALNDDKIIPEWMAKLHENNEVYIHDLDSYAIGMPNCFGRDTELITSDGVKKFYELRDGEKIKVIDRFGQWRDATVRCYGRKQMNRVHLVRGIHFYSVLCTPDHRWYLKDGTETNNLKVGDVLYNTPDLIDDVEKDAEYYKFWCFGFIIGDGTTTFYGNNKKQDRNAVRLCGDKIKYRSIFENSGYATYRARANGTSGIDCSKSNTGFQKQSFLTNKTWRILSHKQKVALFEGYYAADGYHSRPNAYKCCTSDTRIVEMIKEISCCAGYYVGRIKRIIHDTNFKDDAELFYIALYKHTSISSPWKVQSITKAINSSYEAWCVEEPVTHSFTLGNGIVTGNCLSCPLDQLFKYGFKVRQTDIRPPRSISTAFQQLAALFQVQSLYQFGGISATHLESTMVPYFRISFYKNYKTVCDIIPKFVKWLFIDKKWRNKDPFEGKDIDVIKGTSIDDKIYASNRYVHKKALALTIKETNQAVESMYHNLNSLQSRSGMNGCSIKIG